MNGVNYKDKADIMTWKTHGLPSSWPKAWALPQDQGECPPEGWDRALLCELKVWYLFCLHSCCVMILFYRTALQWDCIVLLFSLLFRDHNLDYTWIYMNIILNNGKHIYLDNVRYSCKGRPYNQEYFCPDFAQSCLTCRILMPKHDGWKVIISPVKCGMKLLIHYQMLMMQLLKFGNG